MHVPHMIPAAAFSEYLAALLEGNSPAATATVLELHDQGFSVDAIVRDLLAPAQEEVGQLWEGSRVSVPQEHRATAISEAALESLLAMISTPGPKQLGRVALCPAEGEWHAIAARMVAVVLRHMGWRVDLLVPTVPAADLPEFVSTSQIWLAGVSCAMPANLYGAWRVIGALRESGCWVVAGGRGFGGDQVGAATARLLGADAFAPEAMAGHQSLLRMSEAGRPAPRQAAELGQRGVEVSRLARDQMRVAADAVDLAAALGDLDLGVGPASLTAREDVLLLLRTSMSAALLGRPGMVAKHLSWYRTLLLTSDSDPGLADLWVSGLLSRLPLSCHHVRSVLVEGSA